MTDFWQPGTTYAPGATVIPTVAPIAVNQAPANASFDGTLNGWNAMPGWFANAVGGYNNGAMAQLAANAGNDIDLINTNQVPVTVGQVINAQCLITQGPADAGDATALVQVFWFDATHVKIGVSPGNVVSTSRKAWDVSKVAATAPSGAAFAAIGATGTNRSSKGPLLVDEFSWDYANGTATAPLTFTATQTDPGKSGPNEPAWPTTAGVPVTDNEVTWEGGDMTAVTWTAARIMETGATEPAWPVIVGDTVLDGSVAWVCTTPQVTDPNCPQSKYVVILSSKIYAGNDDIVRFSATVNPLDWSTANDAGFLPTGLQTYGSNPVAAMGIYRGNLVVFNTSGFQMWQVDEDPANAALLDALPIGSSQQKALSPVSNDLFFLASQGVRTMGIAAGSNNLQAGDVGMPIDPLIQDAMAAALDAGITPLATYYPSQGQYWLAFPGLEPEGFFLTSKPYPIEEIEELQSSGNLQHTQFFREHPEAFDMTAFLQSAQLRTLLHTYDYIEALDVTFAFRSGTRRDLLHTYTNPAEAMDMSCALLSADREDVLVHTDMHPEALQMSASLLSAART